MVKGFVKTMEASIAIVLILVSIVFLFPYRYVYENQASDIPYVCLKNLDNSGYLRYYALNDMEASLNTKLGPCIPPFMNFTARICATNNCNAQLPSDKPVYLSSYLIAGDKTFRPTLVNLWVWSE